MSVSIVEILAGDKGLDLQNGYWARQPTILGNWQTIRIGARFHVPVSATQSPMNALRFGLCAGTTNVPGKVSDASVDNALMWTSTAASWAYVTSGIINSAASGSNQIAKIESGTGAATTLTGITYLGAISSSPAVIRIPLIITITKGSPNYTVRKDSRTVTTGVADISLAQLYAAMEANDPDVSLGTGFADNSNTIAMDEGTHGALDTVFVTWAQSSPPIYVSEILVARLA